MGVYLATAIVLILYLVLAWFAGDWLRLQSASLLLVRGGLALIGFLGAAVFLWFHRKLTRDVGEPGMTAAAPVLTELYALLNQADENLKSAKLTAGASLRTLPIVFLLGEPNSAKTSTMLHSGLDPELLAGVLYRETEMAPTNTLNIWFAHGTLFIEVGGAILGDARLWTRILNRTNPSGLASAFGKKAAPRGVVVCCDCERLQGGAEKATATGRKLAAQLQVMANTLGASFPVYALFTKLDQVPKFAEFVSSLTADETRQILGTTVAQRDPGRGVFAEEEKNRLGKEFDQLVYSLAEKRLDYLSRENAPAKLPAIYEFPREFRKVRDQVLGFLVEMSRPTQLGTNPFLRGFYFSGLRPVMMQENVAAAPAPATPDPAAVGATGIISFPGLGGRPAPGASSTNVVRSRRVPEWTFLPYLFSEVILRDRAALGTSSQSSKTNVIRRVLLATLAVLFFCAAIGFLVSFLNNRGLQRSVTSASKALATTLSTPVDVPTADQLKHLEQLREILTGLEAHKRDGAPLSYRFGLYSGDSLYPEAQKIYFAYFFRLLLNSTERSMAATLHQLPENAVLDQYQDAYATLKAYLITTGFHDKSSKDFLAPMLWSRWPAANGLDQEQTELAHRQFEYYSEALIAEDPYSLKKDSGVVEHAQMYLRQFSGANRFYQIMLIGASKNSPKLNFNRQFQGSSQVVISSYDVPGAFTKDGFAAMLNLLQHPEKFNGEPWVMGEQGALTVNGAMLQGLRQRYYEEFVSHWQNVLKNSTVLSYTGFPDAKRKLEQLSGQSSPLLELFWFISQNTNVEDDQIKNAFQPVHTVVPPAGPTDNPKFILSSNKSYVDAIRGLQAAIDQLSSNQADPTLMAQARAAKSQGLTAAVSTLDSASVNQSAIGLVRGLLQAPFKNADPLIDGGAKSQLNSAGQALCSQFAPLMHFFPFSNTASASDLPLAQLNQVFAPDSGALWTTYNQSFKQYLVKQGARYVVLPGVKLNPSFVAFFNKAAEISQTLYPAGGQTPRVSYTLRQTASNVPELALRIGTETLSGTGQPKPFIWTGGEDVQVTAKGAIFGNFIGAWAVSHFVADGSGDTPGSNNLEYTLKSNNRPIIVDGKPQSYSYQLQVSGVNVFNLAVWSALRCVPQVQ